MEFEKVIDEEHDNKLLSMKTNKLIPSITNLPVSIEENDHRDELLLEYTANALVESILAEILYSKTLNENDDEGDKNSGVRELSEDEDDLQELDENDMNETDEFIVFATQSKTSDDDQLSDAPRCNFNRLYTFSKANQSSYDNSKQTVSNKVC